ncbi:MAG: hypothetical protein JNL98_27585 [Bryobacterales bacterium]|nr:hypothetical protein [Bryobacterales bacterium]
MKTRRQLESSRLRAPSLTRRPAMRRIGLPVLSLSAGILSNSLVSNWAWIRHLFENAVWGS